MMQYVKILKKKWLKLLLFFVLPFIILSMVAILMVGTLVPTSKQPIVVGIIDEDKTEETQMFRLLMEEGESLDSSVIKITYMTEQEATEAVEADEISVYFTFPVGFTDSLYEGNAVSVPLVGNPKRPVDSYLVRELFESLSRYIGASQASILTINDYGKELHIEWEIREEFLFNYFIEFTFFALNKSNKINEEVVVNVSTDSPVNYYIIAVWFIAFSILLLGIYVLLEQEEHQMMRVRLKMFGVAFWHQVTARFIITISVNMGVAMLTFILVKYLVQVNLYPIDYVRIFTYVFLYNFIVLSLFSIVTILINSEKFRLLLQSVLLVIIVAVSGALVPGIYFPIYLQAILPYTFSNVSFFWLIELALLEKNYAEYSWLVVSMLVSILAVVLSTMWKEWTQR